MTYALKDWQEEYDTVLFAMSNSVAVEGRHVTWNWPIRYAQSGKRVELSIRL